MRAPALAALLAAGCAYVPPEPPGPNPCDPNPCAQAHRTVCSNQAGLPVCLCDPGYLPRPAGGCEAVTEANCPTHAGDSAEPDDCLANARAIAAGEAARSQSVDPVGDYDFFALTTSAANVYLATASPAGSLAPRIDLFDASGGHVSSAEYSAALGFARLGFRADYGGVYYLRVSHSPLDPSVGSGGYSFFVGSGGVDEYGNTRLSAAAIAAVQAGQANAAHAGAFQYDADEDWLAFSATASVQFTVSFDPGQVVPQMEIYTDAGDLPLAVVRQAAASMIFSAAQLGSTNKVYLRLLSPPGGGSYQFDLTYAR